jgi:hypothetical protein
MKYNFDTSRMGMLIFLGVALAALWLIVAYGFYKESERAKYDVRVSPGAVTYGTHSTALMPMTVSPLHKGSIPMLSGAAIRSYAHSGHASMPAVSANQSVIHTTSSAKVKNIGSGMGGGGIATTSGSSSRRGARGITYGGGGSVAMPSIAMVSASSMSRAADMSGYAASPRRARMTLPDPGTGDEGDWFDGGGDGWWFYDGDKWIAVWEGATRIVYNEGGKTTTYQWTNGEWVEIGNFDPVPVGATPWILMLLLAAMYIVVAKRKNEKEFC